MGKLALAMAWLWFVICCAFIVVFLIVSVINHTPMQLAINALVVVVWGRWAVQAWHKLGDIQWSISQPVSKAEP